MPGITCLKTYCIYTYIFQLFESSYLTTAVQERISNTFIINFKRENAVHIGKFKLNKEFVVYKR